MKYMVMFYESGSSMAERSGPDAPAYWGAWSAYMKAMSEAGILVSGAGLKEPSTATTVRERDGRRRIQDGPFADAKEQLGGYVVLDVPDLDAALTWAARAPCVAQGGVEVRPFLDAMPG